LSVIYYHQKENNMSNYNPYGGLGATIGVGLTNPVQSESSNTGFLPYNYTSGGDITAILIHLQMAVILVVISLIVSVIYLQLMKAFTKPLIYIGMGFTLLLFIASAIYAIAFTKNIFGIIISLLFVVLLGLYFWSIRNRIPFAVEVIKNE
jgi:hypothetical protein